MWTHTLLGLAPLALLSASSQIAPQPPAAASTSLQQERQQRLVDLVPAEAFMAFHWNDPAAMISEGEDSAFVKILVDPRWADAFGFATDEQETAEEDLESLHTALSGISEVVVWLNVQDWESVEDPVFFGMMVGEPSALDALQGLHLGLEEVESWDGMTLYRYEEGMLLREGSWIGILSSTEAEGARATLEALRDLAYQDEVPAGFFQQPGLSSERSGAHFELGIHLEPLWDELMAESGGEMPQFLQHDLQAMSWMYGSANFGSGNQSDWELIFPLAKDGFFSSLLATVDAPTREDLARIPKAAMTYSAGSLDLQGAIDVIIEAISEIVPDPESEWEAVLEQGSQMLGVDLQGDFIDQIEGTMIAFGLEDPSIEFDGLVAYGMTYVLDVHDATAVGKTLDGVFGFLGMMGLGEDVVEEEEAAWGRSWLVNIEDMMEIVVGCDSSAMIFSMDAAGVDAYQALKKEPNPEHSILAHEGLQSILNAFDELPMSVGNTDWTLRAGLESIESAAELEEDPDFEEIAEFMTIGFDIATDHLSGWTGYTMETSSDRLRILLKTR